LVGRELAKLHLGLRTADDPHGWLDEPSHGTPRVLLPTLVALGRLDAGLAQRMLLPSIGGDSECARQTR